MKIKSEYNKQEYLDELVDLWVDVCNKVYKGSPKGKFAIDNILKHEAERAWEGTNYTPLEYVLRYADPKNVTNQIGHGQKAREKRWDKWVENIQLPKQFVMDRSYHLAEIASKIVEDEFGEKEMPEGFKTGLDYLPAILEKPIRWTKIKCSQCQSQVYFDLIYFRHRCNKCGYGF